MEENNNNESQVKKVVKKEAKKLAVKGAKKFLPAILPYVGMFFLILIAIGVVNAIPFMIKDFLGSLIGIFDSSNKKTNISATYDNTILGAAQQVHDEEMTWVYYTEHEKEKANPDDIVTLPSPVSRALANPDKTTCCSTYVSCVLYASGYFSEEEISTGCGDGGFHTPGGINVLLENSPDWIRIDDKNNFKAGDIVFCEKDNDPYIINHVQIYAGDGKWYNAGCTYDIQHEAPKQGTDNWDAEYVVVWAYRATGEARYTPPYRVAFGGHLVSIKKDGSYRLNVKDLSKRILAELESKKIDTELIGFETEELGDLIDEYIKAEVATTYPKTGCLGNDVDGNIIIKKAIVSNNSTEPEIKKLKYKKYEDFSKWVKEGNSNALDYFSINPSTMELCIARKGSSATYEYLDGTTKVDAYEDPIVEVKMDFQKYLQNYITPTNFLITLHVISQDKNFMKDVLDMTLGNREGKEKITLTYVESSYIGSSEYTYGGREMALAKQIPKEKLAEEQATLLHPDTMTTEEFEEYIKLKNISNGNIKNYYNKAEYKKVVVTSTSGKWHVTEADTWLKSTGKELKEIDTKTTGGEHSQQVVNRKIDSLIVEVRDEGDMESEYWKVDWTIIASEHIKSTNTSKKYTIIDKNNEIVVDDFVNLINKYPEVKNNLTTAPSTIFHLLQQDPKTQRLERIMRYVMFKLNDVDYGIRDGDLDFLLKDDFRSASNTLYGGTLKEKIWFALLQEGYTEYQAAGTLANLWAESGIRTDNMENSYAEKYGWTDESYTEAIDQGTYSGENFTNDAIGYGLAQWTAASRKKGLYAYKISAGYDSIADEELQIEYLIGEMSPEGGCDGFAHFSFAEAYRGYTYDDWLNADSPEVAAAAFCCLFERPASSDTSKRQLQARKYYEELHGRKLPGFVEDRSDSRVVGYYTSTRGRTFTILNQTTIEAPVDWGDKCNRAACTIIASGYSDESPTELINVMNTEYARERNPIIPKGYFELYGLERGNIMGKMEGISYINILREQLESGGYAVIWVYANDFPEKCKTDDETGKKYYEGKTKRWTCGDKHWVAILDYRVRDGQEEIYIADWTASDKSWYDIDEFYIGISQMAFISEK